MSQLLVEYPLTSPHAWDNPLARGADGCCATETSHPR